MTDTIDGEVENAIGQDVDAQTAPPHDMHAEEAVLGAVLKAPTMIGTLVDLSPQDFYSNRYRTIWRAMLDLWQRNVPVDFVSLDARLQAPEFTDARVGIADLAMINLSVPTATHVGHYAKIVQDTATQRKLVDAAQKIAERCWRNGADVDQLIVQAEALLAAAKPRRSGRDLYDPERWAETWISDLEARAVGQRTAVSTGLTDVDAMTLGLEAGGLYLLMATPGTGKTELAMQIAMYVAQQYGAVVFASLEMSAVELAHRYARISRGMDRNHLAKGSLSDSEREMVLEIANKIERSRFWPATPTGHYTTADLRADALEVRSKGGKVALIVADYVQRFRDRSSNTSSREENIGMVAENLKSIAREFGCPVLAPVQPNREYVNRPSKRPVLSDLRESGKLEQEADVVFGLYRDEKHDQETKDRGLAELHMLKNRSGVGDADGMRKIRWLGTRYEDIQPRGDSLPWAAD